MFGDLLPRMTEKERVLKMIKTTPDTMTLVRSLTSDEGIKESLENITAKPSKENVISFMESLPIIEQEGNRIVNFMPKDIATLYKLYFDQAAKMVNRYIKYIKKEEMNKTDLLEQVELFIIEYCNNSIKFANDLDRYLALMQDYTKTKLVPLKVNITYYIKFYHRDKIMV